MHRRTWLAAIVLAITQCPFAIAQLQAPPDYRQKMGNLFQSPPDAVWVNEPKPGTLPQGVTHHTYHSQSMGHDVGYCIYLPPQYEKEPQRRFPVIYHLHGVNGDELSRVNNAEVLHEGIVAG